MSGSKWAVVGVAAGVVGVAALSGVALAYFINKEEEDFRQRTMGGKEHISSRPITTEVQIPQNQAGIVIGRGGQTIREIQSKSNTRIHFKDELATEDFRYISISGLAEDVKLAEILIYQTLTNQPMHESLELKIPNLFIGAIIGRNGDSIRSMQDRSKCRIDVERRSDQADRKVVLRGTKDQIQMAKNFILDIVKEEKVFKGIEKTLFLTSEPCENGDEKALKMAEQNLLEGEELDQDVTEIYVSSVMDPDLFYVQKVGAKSVELDKLVQEMTAFYELQGEEPLSKVDIGSIVATKLASDGSWYRAKVVKITVDDYDESQIESQVEFLDFGLSESKDLSELFSLKPEFLKLKFQSISACLAQVKPVEDNQWSNQALDDFETLTHSAQWKPICAQIVKYKIVGENEKCLPCLKLVDTNGEEDVDIGEEMVRLGHAKSM